MSPRRTPQPVDSLQLTTSQAAQVLGLSTGRVRQLSRSGLLPSTATAAGHRRYTLADLRRYAAARAAWQRGVDQRRRPNNTPRGGE